MTGYERAGVTYWEPREGAAALPRRGGWADGARCVEVGPGPFFPDEHSQATAARSVCRGCPARLPCLEYALDNYEHGVWGGFTERGREVVRAQRKAGESLEDIITDDDAEFYAALDRAADLAQAAGERRRANAREKHRLARLKQQQADLRKAS